MDEMLRKELLRSELKEKNKGKQIIPCKYRTKYPDSVEREYLRMIQRYMSVEKDVFAQFFPELKKILNTADMRLDARKDRSNKKKSRGLP